MPHAEPSIVAILPSRWGSSRFPGKSLHPIAGKPLVQHAWERAKEASHINRVIIATDDERIAEAARSFGAEVAMTCPDHQSGTDRIAEVARTLSGITHVINVQGDEPLVDPALLNRLATSLIEDPTLDMVTAANPFSPEDNPDDPNLVKTVLDASGNALYFSRSRIPYLRDEKNRADAPPYLRHHGLYGFSLPFLLRFVSWPPSSLEKTEQLEQLRALENGARVRVLITDHASIGVDTPAQVEIVEKQLLARAATQA